MKIYDVITNIQNTKLNNHFLNQVKSVYHCNLNDFASRVLSLPDNGVPYDDELYLYKVSDDMLLAAEEEMHIDFTAIHLIPVFDFNDNDYICYDFANDQWCIFNIVDEIKCLVHDRLIDLVVEMM